MNATPQNYATHQDTVNKLNAAREIMNRLQARLHECQQGSFQALQVGNGEHLAQESFEADCLLAELRRLEENAGL